MARGIIAVAFAAVLSGCGHSGTDGKAAADRARAQVTPAAQELYQKLVAASPRSVAVLDGTYLPCGTGKTRLYYGISLRLFPFGAAQDTDFDAYRDRVVGLVRDDGWTLQPRSGGRSVYLPSVPSAYYSLSKQSGRVTLSGALGLFGDPKPSVGVGGTLSVNSPCFDAHAAAESIRNQTVSSPFPSPSTPPSPSPS